MATMNKMKAKTELRQIKRDLDYYMKEYELSQKEAYEYVHERYYIRMMLTKDYVDVEKRKEIYDEFKTGEKEWKENYMQNTI